MTVSRRGCSVAFKVAQFQGWALAGMTLGTAADPPWSEGGSSTPRRLPVGPRPLRRAPASSASNGYPVRVDGLLAEAPLAALLERCGLRISHLFSFWPPQVGAGLFPRIIGGGSRAAVARVTDHDPRHVRRVMSQPMEERSAETVEASAESVAARSEIDDPVPPHSAQVHRSRRATAEGETFVQIHDACAPQIDRKGILRGHFSNGPLGEKSSESAFKLPQSEGGILARMTLMVWGQSAAAGRRVGPLLDDIRSMQNCRDAF
jgi:hypothetical protein